MPLLTLNLLAVLLSGCWYGKDRGEALQRDVDMLKQRLQVDIQQSQAERKKLQGIMEKATSLLTRNSADVGVQVDRIQAKVDFLTGEVEEHQKILKDLSQQFTEHKAKEDVRLEGVGQRSSAVESVPQDKNQLFNLAESKFSAGAHQEARQLLRQFINQNTNDPKTPQAQLMLGDSYFAESKFAPAVVEYKKIIEGNKRSPYVPDALYKTGMSFYQLKWCTEASVFLNQLTKDYRKHPQAARAQKVLQLIKRYKRNRAVCIN
jgi:TolA-binding protein